MALELAWRLGSGPMLQETTSGDPRLSSRLFGLWAQTELVRLRRGG